MSKLNYPPIKFYTLYKEVLKVYFYYFLNKRDKKIYWFGVAALPLIILSTAVIFKKKDLKNKKLINLKIYKERISIKYFKKRFGNKMRLKNFFYKILNIIFFFKKKITIIYSTNNYTDDYCNKKNYFTLKYNPLEILNKDRLEDQIVDQNFQNILKKYINKLNEKFLHKKNNNLNEIKNSFIKFYKIYLFYINETWNLKKLFITSYSSIFFIRLFMAAIKFNKKSKFINLTHGEVEILNQDPDIIYDGFTLSDINVCKENKFKIKFTKLYNKYNNFLTKPSIRCYNNKINFLLNSKSFKSKENLSSNLKKKKILIIGYPFSKKFDVTTPYIYPSKMYLIENKLIKFFKKNNKFDVYYKAHPDTHIVTKKKIIIENNFITEKFENIFLDYDYLVFTYHRSTTLGYALRTKKPILLLFHKEMDLDKKTINMFKKRISFIKCYINTKNLMDFHESSIMNNLHKAKNMVINKTDKDIFRL